MTTIRICSWNINGLRAATKTGDFQKWLGEAAPDIAGFQEVKATPEQVEASLWEASAYEGWWHTAERPGYSGALLLSRLQPESVTLGLGIEEFDREGRVIQARYPHFTLLTAYFPNSAKAGSRLDFKLAFCEAFLSRVNEIRASGSPVIFMGDLNIAHTANDLARPEENVRSAGFLPPERAWMDRFIAQGYVDTFRAKHPDRFDAYTYWDAWRDRRARNIGWRIDYVMVSQDLYPRVENAFTMPSYLGSDHCPVGIDLTLPD